LAAVDPCAATLVFAVYADSATSDALVVAVKDKVAAWVVDKAETAQEVVRTGAVWDVVLAAVFPRDCSAQYRNPLYLDLCAMIVRFLVGTWALILKRGPWDEDCERENNVAEKVDAPEPPNGYWTIVCLQH